jgi:hypothetical protein
MPTPVLFIYYESMNRKLIQNLYMNVGVMKDYKLRDLLASHSFYGNVKVIYYESINKAKAKDKMYGGVGVMKDYNLTLKNLRASHTLSWLPKKKKITRWPDVAG